jgi:hypothetical protein
LLLGKDRGAEVIMDIEQQAGQTAGRSVWRAVVYVLAIVLIGLGLWSLGGAIYAAWELFRDPDSIGYFAKYFLESTGIAALVPKGGEGLAHYIAWVAVILLLLVLGKLGAWALGAAAQLLAIDRSR